MDFEFRMLTCSFSAEVELKAVKESLAGKGKMVELGPRGFRFVPDNRQWPVTYFNPGGTIELATKDLYLDDVMHYIERLARWTDVSIESNISEYGGQNRT